MTLSFPVNTHDALKKSLAATYIHNFKPYNQRSKNYQKKLFIVQAVFAFQLWKHKSLTHKFLTFSHLLFSSRLCLLTSNLNLVFFFFSAFSASSRNSLSIESQKAIISAFFQSSISLMLPLRELNWVVSFSFDSFLGCLRYSWYLDLDSFTKCTKSFNGIMCVFNPLLFMWSMMVS